MNLFKLPLAAGLVSTALLLSTASIAQTTAAPSAAAPELAKQAAGQLAAAGWLAMLDQGNWGGAYEASSQSFRNMVPIGAWMDSIPGVRKPFGIFQERSLSNVAYKTSLPGRANGEYITVIFDSTFSDKKDVEEIVTTQHETDGQWRVIGYQPR